jgi:hydrogenase nickel incorporation protein HypA/HybF
MHELSIAENICDVALAHVTPGHRLTKIRVTCGPFSGVVAAALDFCFEITAKHKGATGAVLEIETPAAAGCCSRCGVVTEVTNIWTACKACGHAPLTVEGGRELRITNIEVEEV